MDTDGREARRFGAATSGQAYLYDQSGCCLFAGGITPLRGHEGDNPGMSAILSWILEARAESTTWPVTGCPLFDSDVGSASGRPTENDA
jgi:hypothetical protein